MEAFLVAHDAELRLYALLLGSLILLWESWFPAVAIAESVILRWLSNILLFVLAAFLTRIAISVTALGLSIIAAVQGWGLFNLVDLPAWLAVLIGLFILDAMAYLLHVAMHRIPFLWRIHAVHHSDKDFDCTTGLRFHPIEALIAVTARLVVVVVFGIPVISIVAYETWAILAAFYTHANVKIPPWLECYARKLLITPSLHRIHHSVVKQDSMSNFGVVFSLWDRILSTYRNQSEKASDSFKVGLNWFNSRHNLSLVDLIVLPVKSAPFKEESSSTIV